MVPHHPDSIGRLIWRAVGAAIGIGLALWLAGMPSSPFLLASLGGSAIFLFGLTNTPAAQPRALFGGHLGSALIGILCYQAFGDAVWVSMLALAFTLLFMLTTRTVHPPAGANPLIMIHGHADFFSLWQPVGLGIIMAGCGCRDLEQTVTGHGSLSGKLVRKVPAFHKQLKIARFLVAFPQFSCYTYIPFISQHDAEFRRNRIIYVPGIHHKTIKEHHIMKKSSSSVCALLVVFLVLSHVAVCKAGSDYSNWTVNLSGIMDDANYSWFDYDSLKMVVSGQNVHVVWLSIRTDYGENRLNYRRSTDGGRTFGPVKMLATGVQTQSFSSEWQGLAVDGTTVHVVFTKDSPNGVYYLRSTDNGDTFEAAKAIYSTSWSSYSGLNMAAAGGTVTVAFAANDGNGAQPKDVLCAFSNDGGATFSTTTIAHSDLGHSPIWQFGVGDMVRSGSNIYILYTILDQNIYTTPGHLYLASSNDGGQSFNPSLRVNVKSSDDQYYLNSLQDAHYSPNLAAVGNNVYIIWVNTEVNHFDGTSTRTLRFRRSTDKGVSLEAPVTLSSQTASVLQQGQETVAASGNNVYVATAYKDGSGTYFWRSTDSGGSFDAPKKISDGGWWTTLLTDPADASKLHITNGNYVTSNNDGASFKGVLTLQPDTLGQWRYPVLAVGSDGVVHYAATYNRYDFSTTFDVYYRRLAPAPVPSGPPKVLHLVHDSEFRSDNMQVAASPDINLTSAMTVEFRFRKIADGHLYNYNIIAAKKRAASSGSGTYEFGLWNDGTGTYLHPPGHGGGRQPVCRQLDGKRHLCSI